MLFICAFSLPLRADQKDPALEELFELLGDAKNIDDARNIEEKIWVSWRKTDDPHSQALLDFGEYALATRRYAQSLQAFTELIEREPDFAEAWNKRATLYYVIGEDQKSIQDIARTLALEPRHFGALSGLGLVLLRQQEWEKALESFEGALAVHPNMPTVKAHIQYLTQMLTSDTL